VRWCTASAPTADHPADQAGPTSEPVAGDRARDEDRVSGLANLDEGRTRP
jgi:hypothetical protein